jgi:hypothetical protein
MAGPAPDIDTATETGDDGAIHLFWAFIRARRARRDPDFDLEDLAQLRQAIAEFQASR